MTHIGPLYTGGSAGHEPALCGKIPHMPKTFHDKMAGVDADLARIEADLVGADPTQTRALKALRASLRRTRGWYARRLYGASFIPEPLTPGTSAHQTDLP